MRAYRKQNRVEVNEREVERFAGQWPGSGLRGLRGVSFTFADNGDLVDIGYKNGGSERWDGPALVALSHDAQGYLERGERPEWADR